MITGDRISRKQRLKSFGRRKAKIALILALILAVLVIGNTFRMKFTAMYNHSFIADIFQGRYAQGLDSLAVKTGRDFLLTRSPEPLGESSDSASVSIQKVYQPWPSAMPLLYYSREIQKACDDHGIECDFMIYGKKDSLVCRLKSGNRHELIISVIPDGRTKLESRSLGIILENIYELDNDNIIRLIDSRIPFGYLATADVFPAGDIKRRLRSGRVASIISVSASKKDLAEHAARGKKSGSAYDKYVSDLLGLHPNLSYLDIERSDDIDYMFVEDFIDAARDQDIGYIYKNRIPDRTDSMAYAAGLTFISSDIISDYTEKNLSDIRGSLTTDLVLSKTPAKIIVSVDISKMPIGEFINFLKYLRGLGINILYINKLSDDPEFTIRDL